MLECVDFFGLKFVFLYDKTVNLSRVHPHPLIHEVSSEQNKVGTENECGEKAKV